LIRLAVFGSPVAHSLSPVIHLLFAQQCEHEIEYVTVECLPEEFESKVGQFIDSGARGCNITAPLKHTAWQYATTASQLASHAQAANTLVFDPPSNCFADSTDGRGLVKDLLRHIDVPVSDSRVLILGAGGATAGVLADLLSLSPHEIVIANRTFERARNLVERFASLGKLSAVELEGPIFDQTYDLVINASSLGHEGLHPALPASALTTSGLCYDLNYGQAANPLKSWCKTEDIRYQDGLGMLVEQAAVSFKLWTGFQPHTDAILDHLRSELS
jgi:shikimate dehydrogenase